MYTHFLDVLVPLGFVTRGLEDVHVHTHWCDDSDLKVSEIAENAIAQKLWWVNTTTHARKDTSRSHVEGYAKEMDELRGYDFAVTTSLEVKILNGAGDLDLPEWYTKDNSPVDFLLIADHQVPLKDGPANPNDVKKMIESGEVSQTWVAQEIITATINAVQKYPGSILAHPFSIFPKIGIDPNSLPKDVLHLVASAVRNNHCAIDVNTKWATPGLNFINICISSKTPVLSGSDAHHKGMLDSDRFLPHRRG